MSTRLKPVHGATVAALVVGLLAGPTVSVAAGATPSPTPTTTATPTPTPTQAAVERATFDVLICSVPESTAPQAGRACGSGIEAALPHDRVLLTVRKLTAALATETVTQEQQNQALRTLLEDARTRPDARATALNSASGVFAKQLDLAGIDRDHAATRLRHRVVTSDVARIRFLSHHKPELVTTDPLLRGAPNLLAVNAFPAWHRTTGTGQRIAIVDTGVDATDPELRGPVAASYDELLGPNPALVRNVVVDSVDLAPGTAVGVHGTQVARFVAGRLNNGVGAAGVAPGADLISVRVCNDTACTSGAVAGGIAAALEAGATVVNVSAGGSEDSLVEKAVVDEALRRGVVVVAAAGNNGAECDTDQDKAVANCGNLEHFPAAHPGVLSVTSPKTATATWQNHTPGVDLSAPGWKLGVGTDAAPVTGTSFSAAQVSGAAALVRSVNPALTPAEVAEVLRSTAAPGCICPGFGAGTLDVGAAVAAVTSGDSVTRSAGSATYVRSGVSARVQGAILARYDAAGAERGPLGWPVSNELSAAVDAVNVRSLPTRAGVVSHFERGAIFWSPATGAQVVRGAIGARFAEMIQAQNERAFSRTGGVTTFEPRRRADVWLGYPTSEELPLRGGVVQRFQGGLVYWAPGTGAHALRGAILEAYGTTGYENGRLGYPVTSETALPGGAFTAFQGGSIYWSPATGAHVVQGALRDAWGSTGWERGYLGYPVSAEYPVQGGVRQNFQGRSLVYTWATRKVTETRR
ncbi:S8 family serine peptidase [Kineococcus sp. NUM-3379]